MTVIDLDKLTDTTAIAIREQTLAEERARVIDLVIREAGERGWCSQATVALNMVYGAPEGGVWRDSEGYDFRGIDSDGFDRDGFDEHGDDREGFNRAGWNRTTGKNREGIEHPSYQEALAEARRYNSETPSVRWCGSCDKFHDSY